MVYLVERRAQVMRDTMGVRPVPAASKIKLEMGAAARGWGEKLP